MKSPLLIVATLAVAILTAALIAPVVIDWNAYRSEFERQITSLVGRKAAIVGPISVRLLPAPRIRLANVRIANPPGTAAPYLLTVDKISMRVALAPLLSRRIVVSSLRFIGPVIEAEVLANGEQSWRRGRPATFIETDNISLARTVIEKGTLRFRDGRNGLKLDVTDIEGELSATALSGPLRFSGNGIANGVSGELAVDLGRADSTGAQRLSVRVKPDNPSHPRLGVDVALGRNNEGQTYAGTVVVERGPVRAEKPDQQSAASGGPAMPYRLSARLSGTSETVLFDDLVLSAGGLAPSLKASGHLHLGISKNPTIDADVQVGWIKLDPMLAAVTMQKQAKELAAMATRVLRRGLKGGLKLAVTAGSWREKRFGEVRFAARLSPGQMIVNRATAKMPGGSLVSLAGRFDAGTVLEPKTEFTGTMAQSGDDLRKFLRWAAAAREGSLGVEHWRPGQRFSLAAAIKTDGRQVSLSRVKARAGAAHAQGSLKFRLARPYGATIKVVSSGFDTANFGVTSTPANDGIHPLWERVRTAASGVFAGLGRVSLSLDLTQSRIAGVDLTRVGLDAVISRGDINLGRGRVTLRSGAKVTLEGVIAGNQGPPSGFLDFDIEARTPASLEELAELAVGKAAAGRIAPMLQPIGPAHLKGRMDFSSDQDGRKFSATASGALGAGDLTAIFEFAGDPAALRDGVLVLQLDLGHEDGRNLLAQAGVDLPKRGGGKVLPGHLRLSLEGNSGRRLTIDGEVAAMGARGTVSGEAKMAATGWSLDTRLMARGNDGRPLLAALGIMPAGLVGTPKVPLKVTARLAGSPTRFSINELTGTLGPARLSGEGKISLTGAVPQVSGVINSDAASLPWLFGALVARTGSAGNATAAQRRSRAFDLSWLRAFDLNLNGTVAEIGLGSGLKMTAATYTVSQKDGELRLEKLEGRTAGGALKLTGSARERVGALVLKAEVKMTNGLLERLITGKNGASPLRGRVDVEAKMQANARTGPGLRAALTGKARLRVEGGALAGVDAASLVKQLTTAGNDPGEAPVLLQFPGSGEFRFQPVTFDIAVANGVLRASSAKVSGEGISARIESLFEPLSGKLDSEWRLTFSNLEGAPPLSVVIAGPLKSVRQSFDDRNLRAWIKLRSMRRQIDRLERERQGILPPREGARLVPGATN